MILSKSMSSNTISRHPLLFEGKSRLPQSMTSSIGRPCPWSRGVRRRNARNERSGKGGTGSRTAD